MNVMVAVAVDAGGDVTVTVTVSVEAGNVVVMVLISVEPGKAVGTPVSSPGRLSVGKMMGDTVMTVVIALRPIVKVLRPVEIACLRFQASVQCQSKTCCLKVSRSTMDLHPFMALMIFHTLTVSLMRGLTPWHSTELHRGPCQQERSQAKMTWLGGRDRPVGRRATSS